MSTRRISTQCMTTHGMPDHCPDYSSPRSRPRRKERMLQGFGGLDPLVRVQCQTLLQQVDKVIEVLCLRIIHPRRSSRQARAEVSRRLDHRQGSHRSLEQSPMLARYSSYFAFSKADPFRSMSLQHQLEVANSLTSHRRGGDPLFRILAAAPAFYAHVRPSQRCDHLRP